MNGFLSKILRLILSNYEDYETSKVINAILKYGSNLNSLQVAALQGNINFAKLLLKNGEKFDGPEWYVDSIIRSIFSRVNIETRKDMLLLFIKHGLNAGFRNSLGENLLNIFVGYSVRDDDRDAAEVSEILIKLGISINEVKNNKLFPKMTYLNQAIYTENLSLMALFIEKGAIYDKVDCISSAAFYQNENMILFFSQYGIDINSKNSDGCTALHEACKFNDHEKISFLIWNGADVNVENNNDKTPFSLLNSEEIDYDSCIKTMAKEFSKLIYKNLPISRKNMDLIQANALARKHFKSSSEELIKMTRTIFYAPYSYYFVLKTAKNNMKKLANLMKNEEFVTKYEENASDFSYFIEDLVKIFYEAIQLKDESLIVESVLYPILKDTFPDTVIRKLIDNLTTDDLLLK